MFQKNHVFEYHSINKVSIAIFAAKMNSVVNIWPNFVVEGNNVFSFKVRTLASEWLLPRENVLYWWENGTFGTCFKYAFTARYGYTPWPEKTAP